MSKDLINEHEAGTTDVTRATEAHAAPDGTPARVEIETVTKTARRPTRNRNIMLIAVVALVALVAVALLMWSRGRDAGAGETKATVAADEHGDEHEAGAGKRSRCRRQPSPPQS